MIEELKKDAILAYFGEVLEQYMREGREPRVRNVISSFFERLLQSDKPAACNHDTHDNYKGKDMQDRDHLPTESTQWSAETNLNGVYNKEDTPNYKD